MKQQLTVYGITNGAGPGLTFTEAYNSGVPFKRPGDDEYFQVIEKDGMKWVAYGSSLKIEAMSIAYLEATDYELKPADPVIKTLSDQEILRAISDTAKEVFSEQRLQPSAQALVMQEILTNSHIILRKLGLRFE